MQHQDLLQWLANLFEEPVENLSESTRRDEIYGWDSLGMLTLMAELDERFGIQITDKDIRSLDSIGALLALIDTRTALVSKAS